MPTRSLRPCPVPRCPELVRQGRCATHEREYQQHDRERRGSAAARGYDADWRAVRDGYAREHPLCEDCLERERTVAMDVVDHVIPLPHGPRLDQSNLRSLCTACHRVKTEQDRAKGYEANTARRSRGAQWLVR